MSTHAERTEISTSEILYKLGTVESTVKSLSENLTQSFNRLEKKIEDSDAAKSREMEAVRERTREVEKKVEALEDWRDNIIIKVGFLASAISLFVYVFGGPFKHFIEGVF